MAVLRISNQTVVRRRERIDTYGQMYQFLVYVKILGQSLNEMWSKPHTGNMEIINNDMIPSVAERT